MGGLSPFWRVCSAYTKKRTNRQQPARRGRRPARQTRRQASRSGLIFWYYGGLPLSIVFKGISRRFDVSPYPNTHQPKTQANYQAKNTKIRSSLHQSGLYIRLCDLTYLQYTLHHYTKHKFQSQALQNGGSFLPFPASNAHHK